MTNLSGSETGPIDLRMYLLEVKDLKTGHSVLEKIIVAE